MALLVRLIFIASAICLCIAQPVDEAEGKSTHPHIFTWRNEQENGNEESPETANDNSHGKRRPHSVHISWKDHEANRTKRSVESPESENDESHTKRRPHSVHISWKDQQENGTVESPETENNYSEDKRRPHSVHISWKDHEANRTKRSASHESHESTNDESHTKSHESTNDESHTKRRPHSVHISWKDHESNSTKRSAESHESDESHTKRRPHSVHISWKDQGIDNQHSSEESERKGHHVSVSWRDGSTQGPNEDKNFNHLYIPIFWRNAPEGSPGHNHHHGHVHNRREVLFREGDSRSIVLECHGEDRSRKVLKYIWLKNSTAVNTTTTPDLLSTNNDGSHLSLKPVDANAGDYQCLAETSLGTASSRTITVRKTYLNKPDNVTTNKYSPIEGQPLGLPCQIPDGYPKPDTQWLIQDANSNKQKKITDRRIVQSPDGTLWFSNVTREDVSAGFKYVCLAKSPAYDRPVELAEATIDSLQVNNGTNYTELVEQYVSPDFVTVAGMVSEIYCIYGGTPLAHPDWYKDGVNANGEPGDRVSRYNRSSGRRLLIHDTRLSDQGNYTCVVDNGSGAAKSHSLALTVEAKPKFTRHPRKEVKAREGSDLTIPCGATGVPTPNVTWTYNAQPLATNDRITVNSEGLIIKSVQESDKGYYGCLIKNSQGHNFAEAAVTVK